MENQERDSYLLRADSSTTTDFGNSSRPASKLNGDLLEDMTACRTGQSNHRSERQFPLTDPPDEAVLLRALGRLQRRRPCCILSRIEQAQIESVVA